MSAKGKLDVRPGLSMVLRGALEHMQGLLRRDPWLPVPQSGCTFTFGYRGKPLPIGALWRIIERVPDFGGQCPNCKGFLMPFVFGGDELEAGVKMCCIECCRVVYQPMGGVEEVTRVVGPVLAGTPFAIAQVLENRALIGAREPLWRALNDRGVLNLPDEEWTEWRDPDEPWSNPVPGSDEGQPEVMLTPADSARIATMWRRVRRHTPRTPPWLCRPIRCTVPLQAVPDFEPLLIWGFLDDTVPNVGVAGLIPVPGATDVALWVSRLTPDGDRNAIHAVMPPLVARDSAMLHDVLAAAFGRTPPYGPAIVDLIPYFVRPRTAGALDGTDWESILRGAPAFADGRALANRLADIEDADGQPLDDWDLLLVRTLRHAIEAPSPLPFDAAAFNRWWRLVSTVEAAGAFRSFVTSVWRPEDEPTRRPPPRKVAQEKAQQFFKWLDEAQTRQKKRPTRDAWLVHTFATNWYFDHDLPPVPLPVRVGRLMGGVVPENLPMRALFDDFVDWANETSGWKTAPAGILERLGELADEEGDGDGPGPLGTLECPHCGRRRMVTPEFLESAGISLEELPRRALRIGCCRCHGKGALWSGRMS